MNNTSHWIGIDVSKRYIDAALARHDQHFPHTPLRDLPLKRFARTEDGARKLIQWADQQLPEQETDLRVIMEATGNYSVEFTAWLTKHQPQLAPAIENPARAKAFIDSLGQRNSTDGLAARGLAFYGVERRPVPYEPLTPEHKELRDLSRCRDAFVEERAALKNRAKEPCTSRIIARLNEKHRKHLDKTIEKLEQQMKEIVAKNPELKNAFDLLRSIPGVGPMTAHVVLAELGDLTRFRRARQLTAFAGVSPSIKQSGDSVSYKTKLCKRGNPRVRQALFLSAMASLNTKSQHCLKATHQRLCEEGKAGKSALGAVMRKQLVLMRAILISGKPYDPLWKTKGKNAHT